MNALPDWLVKWWHGGDTGLSSRTIAAVMSGSDALWQVTEPHAPHDTSDVGRCVRLLDLAAANGCDWRNDLSMHRLALLAPCWAPVVPRWEEIEAAYHEDAAAQTAWNTAHPNHRYIRGKGRRALASQAIHATFPPSRCWWLVSTLRGHGDPYRNTTPHPFGSTP
jgi:hypothetical protein